MRALLTHTLRAYRPKLLRRNVKPLELEPERPLRHLATLASLTLLPPEYDDELRAQLRIPQTADVDAFHADAARGGVLLLSAHIGAWELMPIVLLPRVRTESLVVYRRLHNHWLDGWLRRRRARAGGDFVKDRGSFAPLQEALREGRLVCMLADQRPSVSKRTVRAPFAGRPATAFAAGPDALRSTTGAAVWFAALIVDEAEPLPEFRLHLERLATRRALDTAPAAEDRSVVAAFASVLDRLVSAHPEQYFWWHRRWRPDDVVSDSFALDELDLPSVLATSNAAPGDLDEVQLTMAAEAADERIARGFDENGAVGGCFGRSNPPPGKKFAGYKKGATGVTWADIGPTLAT